MHPSDFNRPNFHPLGMLIGIKLSNTLEVESFLAGLLIQCIEAGNWIPLKTRDNNDYLCQMGLLKKVEGEEQTYRLTKLAKGLLYTQYGKDEEDERNWLDGETL